MNGHGMLISGAAERLDTYITGARASPAHAINAAQADWSPPF
jgi:hypothetical protein